MAPRLLIVLAMFFVAAAPARADLVQTPLSYLATRAWLGAFGHTDAAAKALKLAVRQEQKPDPNSAYPQVAYFQTPVEIEIGTASGARIERIQIQPKEEQTFTFQVDSAPRWTRQEARR